VLWATARWGQARAQVAACLRRTATSATTTAATVVPVRPTRPLAAAALSVVVAVAVTGCGTWPGVPGAGTPTHGSSASPSASEITALPTFDPATAVGRYAPGFPMSLLRAPDDATVLASSARPAAQGPLTEITLNLTTPSTARQVVEQFGKRLRKAGFEQSETDGRSGLTVQRAYTRTAERRKQPLVESVIVGVLDDGDRRLVTVSGSVLVKD